MLHHAPSPPFLFGGVAVLQVASPKVDLEMLRPCGWSVRGYTFTKHQTTDGFTTHTSHLNFIIEYEYDHSNREDITIKNTRQQIRPRSTKTSFNRKHKST